MTAPVAPMQEPLATPEAAAFEQEMRVVPGAGESQRDALEAIYGPHLPFLKDEIDDGDWKVFAEDRWQAGAAGVEEALHYSRRNREFAEGRQWISSRKRGGEWKEPPAPKEAIRAVYDMTGPALDYRLQSVTEANPGFRFTPANMDDDRQRRAEAWQRFSEYQWHTQNMRGVFREAEYWAQRDGVSFMMTYWDPEKGPRDEDGSLGDMATKVLRIEQVRVSPDATATQTPTYWVVRETIPRSQAVAAYGEKVLEEGETIDDIVSARWQATETTVNQSSPLYVDQALVDRYIVMLEPNAYFPDGLCVVTVGRALVYGPKPLPFRKAPMIRLTDGSSSPLFYPPAQMNRWVPVQMQINMLISKWFESVRKNAGGQFIAKPNAVSTETLIGGQMSILEVRSHGNLDESIKQVTGMSIGNDAKELLDRAIQQFENLSGWNDVARGSFSSDQSGRAILAVREQIAKILAPSVGAGAESMSEWGRQAIEWGHWGYTVPRSIGVVGKSRPDLAREIGKEDLNGVVDVYVDPETMTVMPFALRQYLLENDLEKQVIDVQEYRSRSPFAYVDDYQSHDMVQEAKARRITEAIRTMMPPEAPTWVDDEAIMQNMLQKDLILAAGVPEPMRQQAMALWTYYANQAAMKMGGAPPPPPAPGGSAPQEGIPMDPSQQPLLGNSPSTAAAPVAQMTGEADQNMAASQFERTSPQ